METNTSIAVTAHRPGGDFEIDSAIVSRGMKLPVAHFMAEMRRGNVHGLVEKGEGEDEGRYRLRFRYRGRQLQMVLGSDGQVVGEELDLRAPPTDGAILRTRLRRELCRQAQFGLPTTYPRLAERIAFSSLKAIGLIGEALETMMEEDAREGRPLLAALAVESVRPGLPAYWFYRKASALGLFQGNPGDVESYAFHARELQRAILFYAQPAPVAVHA